MTEQHQQNKPFLRALKCAYKLHKAGLSSAECNMYLIECQGKTELPPASTPAADLLPASFNFADTGSPEYWHAVQDAHFNEPKVTA